MLLMAHSMGPWVAMDTLRQASIGRRADIFAKLGAVVLIEPDIDADVFRAEAARLKPLPRPFVMIVSGKDRALALSARIAGGHPRVGQGADVEALRAMGVHVVDLGTVTDRDAMRHGAFATSGESLTLISSRLADIDTILSGSQGSARKAAEENDGVVETTLAKVSLPLAP